MRAKFFGTRGSLTSVGPGMVDFGANTMCVQVKSSCIPEGSALVVDSGGGFPRMCQEVWAAGVRKIELIQTHWHPDHTGGLGFGVHTHHPDARIRVWGPKEGTFGPQDVIEQLIMRAEVFPVAFAQVRHRFRCHTLEHPGTQALIIHPAGGCSLVPVNVLESSLMDGDQLTFHGKGRFSVDECLVVRMHKTDHPQRAVSYRFEEWPTGKVFVILTDHENTDGIPQDLRRHLRNADLLAQDCQYSRSEYEQRTAGWGHGTPDYCARLAAATGVKRLALLHHDLWATDQDIRARLKEAQDYARELGKPELAETMVACADYMELEV